MEDRQHSLNAILNTFIKRNNKHVKKMLVFDQAPLGGIGRKWVILFCLSLPVFLYAGIFNPTIFGMLGIAQAIIFFIVFLSMIMILVVALIFINNNKVIRSIIPSWNKLFPDVDFRQVISSGVTPYKKFFDDYAESMKEGLVDEKLYTRMQENFKRMQEDNYEIYQAMNMRTIVAKSSDA